MTNVSSLFSREGSTMLGEKLGGVDYIAERKEWVIGDMSTREVFGRFKTHKEVLDWINGQDEYKDWMINPAVDDYIGPNFWTPTEL